MKNPATLKKLFLIFLPLLFLLQEHTVVAQQKSAKVDLKKLDRYYEKVVQDWGVPSMTVGIVKDGKLLFSKGYGVLEVGKNEKPDGNTLYAIASNSKAFTTAIIAMLVEEGKLKWEDKVQDYLPYFELYDPYVSRETTIRDILSHRVGLGTFSGDAIWYKSNLSSEEIIKRAKYLPKAYDFRAGYGYSNLMYITAGEIIEKVTGKSWSQNVQERILQPLEMDRTLTSIKKLDSKGNYATPHALIDGKNVPIRWEDWEEIGATGGIISSVNDLSKWMMFNLNNGIWKQDTLLSTASRNLLWTPHNNFTVNLVDKNDQNQHFSGYGLGWSLSDHYGKLKASHTGGYDGMITVLTLVPDDNLGVVVLTNGVKSPIGAVTNYTLDAMMGAKEKDWSTLQLARTNKYMQEDTRIADRKAKRIPDTKPSLPIHAYTGNYNTDVYGNINVTEVDGKLKLTFEHSPDLSATLEHWHHDVWEIKWDQPHAWFSFGTVKFNTDNNQVVTGMEFDVPNDDIFFEEFKPKKTASAAPVKP